MKLGKMLALSRAVGRNEVKKVEALCSEALAADPGDLMALMALADAVSQRAAIAPVWQRHFKNN